ncbi:hypothetical protein PIB30_095096 [Stylosanthes scabra]|uniref:CCHC-type domain-containing protein n=1 Tax=Stylosanthes scabra TaxID=79078 RepID=A0ABU6SWV2_9FABA|nr:hypothetical protein [Stylosanthes scabra]
MRRAREGRPRSVRIRANMDEVDPNRPRRCGLCKQPGHTRRSCPQRGSTAGDTLGSVGGCKGYKEKQRKQLRTPRICVEEHAYACCSYPSPRLSKPTTLRRGNSPDQGHAYA